MESSSKLYTTLREPVNTDDKKAKVHKLLDDGADINERYVAYDNNTPLHVASIQGDIAIVEFLINRGAVMVKNDKGKTALDIARERTAAARNIEDILTSYTKSFEINEQTAVISKAIQPHASVSMAVANCVEENNNKPMFYYKKEKGSRGIGGHLYEINLLSLIYLELAFGEEIEEFYVGTNIDDIVPWDDICFSFKIRGQEKPFVVFMQAKHKDNEWKGITDEDLSGSKSEFCLTKYHNSYLRIKKMFHPESKNVVFKRNFNEVICVFVVYTSSNAKFGEQNVVEQNIPHEFIQYLYDKISKDGKYFQVKCENTLPVGPFESDFLSNLWICTNQAKQDEVGNKLKELIDKQLDADRKNKSTIHLTTNSVYDIFVYEYIMKWWFQNSGYYLTKDCNFFQQATTDAIENPELSVLNITCFKRLNKIDIGFNEDAIRSLQLDGITSGLLNIVTDVKMFSAIKVGQYFKNTNNYSFVDFDDVFNLPLNEFNKFICELRKTKLDTLIILYEGRKIGDLKTLKEIVREFDTNKILIISNEALTGEIHELSNYCVRDCVRDETINLINLKNESQLKILQETNIIYQGDEKTLGEVIDDGSRHLIKAKILFKLLSNERIEIGKTLWNSNYEYQKEYYTNRYVRNGESPYIRLNNLDDIKDEIVPIIGEPGMGKSTLLTHLSMETKKEFPRKLIARINLDDYSCIFKQWSTNNKNIDIIDATKLICCAILNGMNENQVTFELEVSDGELIMKNCSMITDCTLLEIAFFIYLYNKGEVFILFDGFDEICPQYEKQVITVINTLADRNRTKRNRIWITARPYDNIIRILKSEFNTSYTLQPVGRSEQKIYFKKFWEINLKLQELKFERLNNIDNILDVMCDWLNTSPSSECVPSVYEATAEYLKNELKYMPLTIDKVDLRKKWITRIDLILKRLYAKQSLSSLFGKLNIKAHKNRGYLEHDKNICLEILGIPLYMHIIADYFQNHIKDHMAGFDKKDIKKFDLNDQTFIEIFMETILNRRFREKAGMDLNKSYVEPIYKIGLKEFREMHKKLAAYVIFYEDVGHLKELLSIDDINIIIETMESGEEKTGLIYRVINKVPKFIHSVIAETLGVEYICDLLKTLESHDKRIYLWDFILNILLMRSRTAVVVTFFTRCKNDIVLNELITDEVNSKIIFDVWMKSYDQHPYEAVYHIEKKTCSDFPVLLYEFTCKISLFELPMVYIYNDDIVWLIMNSIIRNLNNSNADAFIEILQTCGFLLTAMQAEYNKVVDDVIDIMKNKLDIDKLRYVLSGGFLNNVIDFGAFVAESLGNKQEILATLRFRLNYLLNVVSYPISLRL